MFEKLKGDKRSRLTVIAAVVLLIAIAAYGLSRCTAKEENADTNGRTNKTEINDSNVVRVALVPTLTTLPYYYALERGYYDQCGVAVEVLTYTSQMDCDTAIGNGRVTVGTTDMFRAVLLNAKHPQVRMAASLEETFSLITCGQLRLKEMKQLKLRTIATTRYSSVGYATAQLLTEAGIKANDGLCPQVNDLSLRTQMLNENQVDASVLPEPYATFAVLNGHKRLTTMKDAQSFGCLAVSPGVARLKDAENRIASFLRAYNMAVDSLNAGGKTVETTRRSIISGWGISYTAIDSLAYPKYKHPALPKTENVEQALRYMLSHGQAKRSQSVEGLLDRKYIGRVGKQ